jgi:hypothetical protein
MISRFRRAGPSPPALLEKKWIRISRKEARKRGISVLGCREWINLLELLARIVGSEISDENLSQYRMRGLRPHRLLGNDPLPVLQMGLEEHASHERDGTSAEARSSASLAGVKTRSTSAAFPGG